MSYLIVYVLLTYRPRVVVLAMEDTGMGKCTMDQHWHNSDSSCHRDSDDSVVKILPKVK